MYPYLIWLTSCACQSLHVLPSPNQPTTINLKDFFFFFIFRGHGWFVSAWHSDASIHTPPSHVNTVCDLLAKSLTTPSHCRPSSRLLCLTLHFSMACIFPSLIYLRQTPSFSHFVFLLLGNEQPLPPLLFTRAHSDTYTCSILYIFTRRLHTLRCLDITHLQWSLSVSCVW